MAEVLALPPTRELRMHDALLINLVGAILVDPVTEEDVLADHIGALRRVLPMCSRDALLVRDLVVAAEAMVIQHPMRRQRALEGTLNLWARARFDAGVALAAVLRWRAGQVYGRLYPDAHVEIEGV